MIYINNKTHSKIPHDNNLFIQLATKGNRILLVNPTDKSFLDITDGILINKRHLNEMIKYNEKLLEKIG